jgi:hypothetical protein
LDYRPFDSALRASLRSPEQTQAVRYLIIDFAVSLVGRGGARIGLQEVAAGQPPTIAHYAIKVAPFDRGALHTRLREVGARVLPATDEPEVVRCADNNGIIVEVRVAE